MSWVVDNLGEGSFPDWLSNRDGDWRSNGTNGRVSDLLSNNAGISEGVDWVSNDTGISKGVDWVSNDAGISKAVDWVTNDTGVSKGGWKDG